MDDLDLVEWLDAAARHLKETRTKIAGSDFAGDALPGIAGCLISLAEHGFFIASLAMTATEFRPPIRLPERDLLESRAALSSSMDMLNATIRSAGEAQESPRIGTA